MQLLPFLVSFKLDQHAGALARAGVDDMPALLAAGPGALRGAGLAVAEVRVLRNALRDFFPPEGSGRSAAGAAVEEMAKTLANDMSRVFLASVLQVCPRPRRRRRRRRRGSA